MTSLVFRALDQQVVGGFADNDAIADDRGTLSYASSSTSRPASPARSAISASSAGTAVAIGTTGRERVIAVLACARLGALPGAAGTYTFEGDRPSYTLLTPR